MRADKSELRRFQDGAICEAVVWEGGPAERHLTVDRLLQYALTRHLPTGTRMACHAGALDGALRRRHSTLDGDVQAVRLCDAAYAQFSKQLRALASDSLPLRVVATQPLCPVLRHAAAFPPLPHPLAGAPEDALQGNHVARCLEPVEVLCQLEGSGTCGQRQRRGVQPEAATRGARWTRPLAGPTCPHALPRPTPPRQASGLTPPRRSSR